MSEKTSTITGERTQVDCAYVNGQKYEIILRNADGTVAISRPNGLKIYTARHIQDGNDQIYGACRYRIER